MPEITDYVGFMAALFYVGSYLLVVRIFANDYLKEDDPLETHMLEDPEIVDRQYNKIIHNLE